MENPSLAYCKELIALADQKEDIVLITADSSELILLNEFVEKHPDKWFDVGIAEQAMTNIAAGFATTGYTPFVSSFAMFQVLRAADNVRNGIAYPNLNVKIISANIGLNVGKNGVTHHALEDIAIMRSIPNMIVLSPADASATRKLIQAAYDYEGPVYMRLDKVPIPVVYKEVEDFQIGKGKVLADGEDVVILATGSTVAQGLTAVQELKEYGVKAALIDIHTIKPLDEELILSYAAKTGAVVTVEPHSTIGGLGGAVSELLAKRLPTRMEFVGVRDTFTESATAAELNEKYGLTVQSIVEAAGRLMDKIQQ